MTGYQDPYHPTQAPQPAKKGWFARSWWWFLPLVIGGPLLCCCGSCGGLIWFGVSETTNMPPYIDGIAACENSKEVEALIGPPVEAAGLWETVTNQGSINGVSGPGGSFTANIPVTGSTGAGWLYIGAATSNGTDWTYSMLEFEDDNTSQLVDLLNSPGITPDPSIPLEEIDTTNGDLE